MKKLILGLILIISAVSLIIFINKLNKDKNTKEIYYTIVFDTYGGSNIDDLKVKENEKIVEPEEPTKEGYEFEYWTLNSEKYDFETLVTKDITLVAKWNEIKEDIYFTVTFDTNGGSNIDNLEIKENNKVDKPENPLKEGYMFLYWTLNDKKYDFETLITKNITLVAKWEELNDEDVYYEVTFDTDGGTNIPTVFVKENDKLEQPNNPIKEGYEFKYWTLNDEKFNFNTEITNDIKLKAYYEKEVFYNISFNTNGGSLIESVNIRGNEKLVIPEEPTKDGYVFIGWYTNNDFTEKYNFDNNVNSDMTLFARFEDASDDLDVSDWFN